MWREKQRANRTNTQKFQQSEHQRCFLELEHQIEELMLVQCQPEPQELQVIDELSFIKEMKT